MRYHITQGYHKHGDKEVPYKELEVELFRETRLTIRRYPSNTFVTYYNDYKGFSKMVYKAQHAQADREMREKMETFFRKSGMTPTGRELDSFLEMYWKMVHMKMEVFNSTIYPK